jgi:hypothetical protein
MSLQIVDFEVRLNNHLIACQFEYNGQDTDTSLISVGDFWLYSRGKASLNDSLNKLLNSDEAQDWYTLIKEEANDYMDRQGYDFDACFA